MSMDRERERSAPRGGAGAASQSDAGLEWREEVRGARPGDRAIRIARHYAKRHRREECPKFLGLIDRLTPSVLDALH